MSRAPRSSHEADADPDSEKLKTGPSPFTHAAL